MINLHDHVVVLIDADNAQLKYTEQVLKLAEYYGEVGICRAYGDWEKAPLSLWREKLPPKIEPTQVARVGKNATDHGLLYDAGEILGADTSYDIDSVIIVSDDGDFASACRIIQRRVIVVGSKKTSKDLRKACDTFYYLEDLDDELQQLEKKHPIPPREVREFWRILRWIEKDVSKMLDWITMAELDEKLHAVAPWYDKNFGKYSLSEWLSDFDWFLEVEGQRVRGNPKYVHYSRLVKAYWEIRTRLIEECIREKKSGISTDSVSLTQLAQVLRELNPDYKTLFGSRKLSAWLKDYPNVFQISEGMVTLFSTWRYICP